jgi:ABC-2 type transport system ATP-binding protein
VADSIEKLSSTGAKRVTVRGANSIPESNAIRNLEVEKEHITFIYCGHPKELIKLLAELDFEDVTLSDPELDEVFMHYYEKEEN